MSYVDVFFNKKTEYLPRTGILKLKQDYKNHEKTVHIFLESEDDYEFYRHALTEVYKGYGFFVYDQKGKKNVIDVFKELDWEHFSRHRVLFLVDKDYDDILGRDSILGLNFFQTRYYSIENYLVNKDVLRVILHRVYAIIDEQFTKNAFKLFDDAYNNFVSHMLPLTSCILIIRKEENHMELDKLKMEKLFFFNGVEFAKKSFLTEQNYISKMQDSTIPKSEKKHYRNKKILTFLEEDCAVDIKKINYKNILDNWRKLKKVNDPKTAIRGKYDLWFLFKFIEALERTLIEQLNSLIDNQNRGVPENQKKKKHKKRYEIHNKNVFDLICSKIDQPADIRIFFVRNRRRGRLQEIIDYFAEIIEKVKFNFRMKY